MPELKADTGSALSATRVHWVRGRQTYSRVNFLLAANAFAVFELAICAWTTAVTADLSRSTSMRCAGLQPYTIIHTSGRTAAVLFARLIVWGCSAVSVSPKTEKEAEHKVDMNII